MFARAELPNGVALRPAGAQDRAFERRLHESRRADLWQADAEPDLIRTVIDQQQQAQTQGYGAQRPEARYYVIERAGVACGRLVIDFDAWGLRVVDLALVPEARGAGIAETVLRALQRVAERLPAAVTLSVAEQAAGLQRRYAALGFRPSGRSGVPGFVELAWQPDGS